MHLDMLTGQADASGDLNTKLPSDSETLAMWNAITKAYACVLAPSNVDSILQRRRIKKSSSPPSEGDDFLYRRRAVDS